VTEPGAVYRAGMPAVSSDPGRWALFDTVSDDEARELLGSAQRHQFTKGEAIFLEGARGDTMHLVDVGHVAVRVTTPAGDIALLRIHGPGDYFGELAVVSPSPRNASITAIDAVETLALTKAQIDDLRARNRDVDRVLLEAMVHEIRRLSVMLLEAMYDPVSTRVPKRLLQLAGQFPVAGGADIPLTQEDLAGLCGATRPTVNIQLQQLVADGVVELRRGGVRIVDLAGLRRAAD
jgi:CRP/FNR family cyclic AMP-dependent transcriptional regulator